MRVALCLSFFAPGLHADEIDDFIAQVRNRSFTGDASLATAASALALRRPIPRRAIPALIELAKANRRYRTAPIEAIGALSHVGPEDQLEVAEVLFDIFRNPDSNHRHKYEAAQRALLACGDRGFAVISSRLDSAEESDIVAALSLLPLYEDKPERVFQLVRKLLQLNQLDYHQHRTACDLLAKVARADPERTRAYLTDLLSKVRAQESWPTPADGTASHERESAQFLTTLGMLVDVFKDSPDPAPRLQLKTLLGNLVAHYEAQELGPERELQVRQLDARMAGTTLPDDVVARYEFREQQLRDKAALKKKLTRKLYDPARFPQVNFVVVTYAGILNRCSPEDQRTFLAQLMRMNFPKEFKVALLKNISEHVGGRLKDAIHAVEDCHYYLRDFGK